MNPENLHTKPPQINALQGDGGVTNDPQLHIIIKITPFFRPSVVATSWITFSSPLFTLFVRSTFTFSLSSYALD